MPTTGERALAAFQWLARSANLARADDLPDLVAGAASRLGATGAVVHVIDYDQVVLVRLEAGGDAESSPHLTVDGTLAGRAYRDVAPQVSSTPAGVTLWMPIVDGTDRLGVLEYVFPADTVMDDELRTACGDVAQFVAELLATRTLYGDLVERIRRRQPLTIPAELQWRLLPPLTFVSNRVAVAGVLAPANEVAGDSFDYAVNGDVAHIAIVDAMGHGLEATLLSTVAVGALRNARRSRLSLTDVVAVMDAQIAGQFGPDKFVTAVVGELDTSTGVYRWVTCGHPPALLVRSGRVVKVLDQVVTPPLGLGLLLGEPLVGEERLEPGDRLLLYSDGVTEARDASGEFFGTQRLVEYMGREAAAGRPAAETLRRLNLAILAHQEGALQDDATTVMVEWLTDEAARSTP